MTLDEGIRTALEMVAGQPCTGCGGPSEYVAVYVPEHKRRVAGYSLCGSCDRATVARSVEESFAHFEALEACTSTGGAA